MLEIIELAANQQVLTRSRIWRRLDWRFQELTSGARRLDEKLVIGNERHDAVTNVDGVLTEHLAMRHTLHVA